MKLKNFQRLRNRKNPYGAQRNTSKITGQQKDALQKGSTEFNNTKELFGRKCEFNVKTTFSNLRNCSQNGYDFSQAFDRIKELPESKPVCEFNFRTPTKNLKNMSTNDLPLKSAGFKFTPTKISKNISTPLKSAGFKFTEKLSDGDSELKFEKRLNFVTNSSKDSLQMLSTGFEVKKELSTNSESESTAIILPINSASENHPGKTASFTTPYFCCENHKSENFQFDSVTPSTKTINLEENTAQNQTSDCEKSSPPNANFLDQNVSEPSNPSEFQKSLNCNRKESGSLPTVTKKPVSRFPFPPSLRFLANPKSKKRISSATSDIFMYDMLAEEEPGLRAVSFPKKTKLSKLILKSN